MVTEINNSILNDLERMLKSSFNIPISLAKSELNPRVGSLVLKKPALFAGWIPDKIKTFYKERGFQFNEIVPEKIIVANHRETNEQYDLYLHDLGKTYALIVSESILKF